MNPFLSKLLLVMVFHRSNSNPNQDNVHISMFMCMVHVCGYMCGCLCGYTCVWSIWVHVCVVVTALDDNLRNTTHLLSHRDSHWSGAHQVGYLAICLGNLGDSPVCGSPVHTALGQHFFMPVLGLNSEFHACEAIH